ncbi:MAG TPA: glycosyltransferase, partial [Pyrinomonadaceae bacterium]|nr:glycosyltransferase [Pyrinomonadaceae bacterium]
MRVYEEEETLKRRRVESPQPDGNGGTPDISVFLPVYNEEPNLRPLHAKMSDALSTLGRTAEIIYVDDGSSDGSLEVLREIAAQDSRVRVIAL